jgi:hypothetical protein
MLHPRTDGCDEACGVAGNYFRCVSAIARSRSSRMLVGGACRPGSRMGDVRPAPARRQFRQEPLMSTKSIVSRDAAGGDRHPPGRGTSPAARRVTRGCSTRLTHRGRKKSSSSCARPARIAMVFGSGRWQQRCGRRCVRISEALALNETDIDPRRGSLLVRAGLGRIRHRPSYAEHLVIPRTCTDSCPERVGREELGIIGRRGSRVCGHDISRFNPGLASGSAGVESAGDRYRRIGRATEAELYERLDMRTPWIAATSHETSVQQALRSRCEHAE